MKITEAGHLDPDYARLLAETLLAGLIVPDAKREAIALVCRDRDYWKQRAGEAEDALRHEEEEAMPTHLTEAQMDALWKKIEANEAWMRDEAAVSWGGWEVRVILELVQALRQVRAELAAIRRENAGPRTVISERAVQPFALAEAG